MSADLYLPTALNFSFYRLNPIVSVYWEAPILFYYNKCSYYHSKFKEKSHFKQGEVREEKWHDFWQKLDEIDVWTWSREYNYRGMRFYENSNWRLYAAYQEKIIKSVGNNSYPPNSLCQPSEKFIALLDAFIELGNSIN